MDDLRPAPQRASQPAELAMVVILGAAAWSLAVASEPHTRACGNSECENWFGGDPRAYIPLGLVRAMWFVGLPLLFGWRNRLPALAVGVAAVGVAFLASPWTTPRGDEDGLWTLIFPFLVVDGLAIAAIAALAGRARKRWAPKRAAASHDRSGAG